MKNTSVNLFFVLIALIVWGLNRHESFPSILVVGACIFLTLTQFVIWLWNNPSRLGKWCHPVPAFFVSFVIVYYYVPFFYILGWKDQFSEDIFVFSEGIINFSVALGNLAFSCLISGYSIFASDKKRTIVYSEKILTKNNLFFQYANFLALFFAIAGMGMFIIFLGTSGRSILSGAYDHQSWGTAGGAHALLLTNLLLGTSYAIEAYRIYWQKPHTFYEYINQINKPVLVVFVMTVLPFLLIGSRGPIMTLATPFVAGYFITVRPLSLKLLIILGVPAALLFQFHSMSRSTEKLDVTSGLESMKESRFFSPEESPVTELANSYGVWNRAILLKQTDQLPADHWPGKFTLQKILGMVPLANKATGGLFDDGEESTTALYMTAIMTDYTFSSGVGDVSAITPYFDFGVPGIIICFFLYGSFVAFFEKRVLISPSIFNWIVWISLIRIMFILNRSEFLGLLQSIVQSCIALWLVYLFTHGIRRIKGYQ